MKCLEPVKIVIWSLSRRPCLNIWVCIWKGLHARWPHVYKNHFLNPLGLGYFWEIWHEWLHLNFDGIPPLSPNCLSLSSLFWIFVSHPSTSQAWPCLAFETRQDWAHSGWYGRKLKIFLDWSLSIFIVRICSFLDFVYLFDFGPSSGGGGLGEIMRGSAGSQCQLDPLGQI
jgi:hypothetical protein